MQDEEKTKQIKEIEVKTTDWLFAPSQKRECDICKKTKTVAYIRDPIVEIEPRELWECWDCYLDRLYDTV